MSIEVQNLSKVYGEQWALKEVSFEAQKGQITGFLGPNGAGKSTTMKIAAGYLQPSSGTVLVNEIDVLTDPIEVRKNIGYLPENNPLYLDMYVIEFLEYAGSFFGLKGSVLRSRVADLIHLTGLLPEMRKKIGALSKGYRQRVGLAQALIHDPPVLFLDEPTSGLDPNQILEIRSLIKNLGKEKTVMLSTHIMQEVQAICDQVVIINKGQLIANDSVEHLTQANESSQVIVLEAENALDPKQFNLENGIRKVEVISQNKVKIFGAGNGDIRSLLFEFCSKENIKVIEMKQEVYSLEDVFHKLTQE